MQLSKSFFVLFLIIAFLNVEVIAQNQSKSAAKNKNVTNLEQNDKAQAAFDEAKNAAAPSERIEKLTKFIHAFPRSNLKNQAVEILITARAELGETNFRSGDSVAAVDQFRRAVNAYSPSLSDNVFNEIIVKIPFNLYFRNQRETSAEIARIIETKVNENPDRLIALARFYLTVEAAAEAKRLARRAAELAPNAAAVYEIQGMAERLDFRLETALQQFARALELDSNSASAKQNLADIYRASGQYENAQKLYQELLQANALNEAARNGLILTLFNLDKKEEAASELNTALEQNPKNFVLQTNLAYWYAANGEGDKAIEFAQKAVANEPRYVWAQIALARGLVLQKRPLEAERALLYARQFGSFPTLDYEIANARFAAGLYDEAAEDLKKTFVIKENNLETKLAARAPASAANFVDLLARERQASIFQFKSADTEATAQKLKELLLFSKSYDDNSDEAVLLETAQKFAGNPDEMHTHRQLYVANRLLARKAALPQVLEITQAAMADLEKSIDVPAATTAVLAEELYEPRRLARASNNLISVPDVSRETLSKIMRGRVEEIAGWALYQSNRFDEAAVRLKRAVGILPEQSAWWRSSYWKLGTVLEAVGKPNEALEAYLRSYRADVPNQARFTIIQALYERINNSLNGLDRKLNETSPSQPSTLGLTKNQNVVATARPATARQIAARPAPTPVVFRNPLPSVIAEIVPKNSEIAKNETENSNALIANNSVATQTTQGEPNAQPANEVSPKEFPTAQVKTESTPSVAATVDKVESRSDSESKLTSIPSSTNSSDQTAQPNVQPDSTNSPETSPETKTNQSPAAETLSQSVQETETVNSKTNIDTRPAEVLITELSETKTQNADSGNQVKETLPNTTAGVAPNTVSETPPKTDDFKTRPNETFDSQKISTNEVETLSDSLRPRVVTRNINEQEQSQTKPENQNANVAPQCIMQVSQKELSILRNGGRASLLVTLQTADNSLPVNNKDVVVKAIETNDIVVKPDVYDETNGKRKLFEILSISENTKTYAILVESPCGKQEVKVRVR